jgi:hypothetical protein
MRAGNAYRKHKKNPRVIKLLQILQVLIRDTLIVDDMIEEWNMY